MHKHLKKLYVQNNFIKKYSPEFTEMVKAGLDVEYAGKCIKKAKKRPLTQPLSQLLTQPSNDFLRKPITL